MTHPFIAVVLGLDVGTSGARALAATASGDVLAEAHVAIPDQNFEGPKHEQNPHDWWRAACQTMKSVLRKLSIGGKLTRAVGIAVTSTSGSLVLADSKGQPLRPAILFDDSRGATIVKEINSKIPPGGAPLNISYSLVKAAWVRQMEQAVWERTRYLLHPADWLTGKLTGDFGSSDYSNALKLGYDIEAGKWGDFVSLAEISSERLPHVVCPGQLVGRVTARASEETGLSSGTPVLAGATDGMAGLIASGAFFAKDMNTTMGTTVVWKALTRDKPRLSAGMYCHRHPADFWAPGAASNTGPGSLRTDEFAASPEEIDRAAAPYFPTPGVCFLLRSKGERFPFTNPTADSFWEGTVPRGGEWYAAQLQSIAFVERWGYEKLAECGIELGDVVFSTGGAARSAIFSQLRSNVMNRVIVRCRFPNAAFGAAVIAAADSFYSGKISVAIQSMTTVDQTYIPCQDAVPKLEEIYGSFREACRCRGYV